MEMTAARVMMDGRRVVGPVRRRVFGAFVEHMGRCVYSGIFEPGHPNADEDGFRTDVLDLVREMGVTVVRYPGGNFVSGYRWEDGVGPVSERPTRLDLAWHSRETNAFGLDEFMRWTRNAGIEPMLALNLGTRGLGEALDLLEYANHPAGTALSDRRITHGATEPYGIGFWCLGNELDGEWQLGHKTADEYGRLAAETGRAMRQFDPDLTLVACGSSHAWMPSFGAWERTVLEHTAGVVDLVSLHAYYDPDDDAADYLAAAVHMERSIETVGSVIDDVVRTSGSTRPIRLSIDEWNVWYRSRFDPQLPSTDWPEAPPLGEEPYSVVDAVVVGSLLIAFLKNADRVESASIAQLVNTLAPIKTTPGGPAWRETTFYPFALTAANASGRVIALDVETSTVATTKLGEVPVVDAVATLGDDGASASVFLVNRSLGESVEIAVDLGHLSPPASASAVVVSDPDGKASNGMAAPERVVPCALQTELRGGTVTLTLPPVSWAMVRLDLR
jgi:alpha-N-arabinofuranosidase